jgi:TonB family protein
MRSVAGNSPQPDVDARRRVLGWVGFTALLHVLALPPLTRWYMDRPPPPARPIPVLTSAQFDEAVREARAERAKQTPAKTPRPSKAQEKKKVEEKLAGQVVDLPPSPDSRPPDHADYLSEHNTRTARETRSRHASADYKNVMNEPTVAEKTEAKSPKPQQEARALEVGPDRPNKDAKRDAASHGATIEIPRQAQRDRLALRFDPSLGEFRNQGHAERVEGNSDRLHIAPGDSADKEAEPGSAPKQGLTLSDLVPQVGVLARISGGPSNDALDNVEEGEGTFLNSREFKYASFFNRMKRSVSQHWRPLAEYQRRDPTGNIYGYRTRVTVLNITLNQDGTLHDLEVKHTSGVDFLDREAIAAFRRAEPFPNPPRGLVDDSGRITFPFGFHLDFSSRGSLQSPY